MVSSVNQFSLKKHFISNWSKIEIIKKQQFFFTTIFLISMWGFRHHEENQSVSIFAISCQFFWLMLWLKRLPWCSDLFSEFLASHRSSTLRGTNQYIFIRIARGSRWWFLVMRLTFRAWAAFFVVSLTDYFV